LIKEYSTITDSEATIERSHSKFIAFAFHVESEEEATAFLSQTKKKYSDATHVCHAFVADIEGHTSRFSDGGEPSGTAGSPILEQIKKRNLVQAMVIVVRYFGGIKLGAGGLVRAYGDAAAAAIEKSSMVVKTLKEVFFVKTDLSTFNKIYKKISLRYTVLEVKFEENACLLLADILDGSLAMEIAKLTGGKAEIKKLGTEYI
jgi:uncharacterized YigZ family protein